MTERPKEPSSIIQQGAAVIGSTVELPSICVPWGLHGSLELILPRDGLLSAVDVEVVSPDLHDVANEMRLFVEGTPRASAGFKWIVLK